MSFLVRQSRNVLLKRGSVFSRMSVRCMGDHGPISQHRDTSDNTNDHSFDFTVENYKKVDAILSRYPSNFKKSGIIPLLDLGQRQNDNFCSLAVMKKVAQNRQVSDLEIYEDETTSFDVDNVTNQLFDMLNCTERIRLKDLLKCPKIGCLFISVLSGVSGYERML